MSSLLGSDATQSAWALAFLHAAEPCRTLHSSTRGTRKYRATIKQLSVLHREPAAETAPVERGHVSTDVPKPGNLATTAFRQDFYSLFPRILLSVGGKRPNTAIWI